MLRFFTTISKTDPLSVIKHRQRFRAMWLSFLVILILLPLTFLFRAVRDKLTSVRMKKVEVAGVLQNLNAIATLNIDKGKAEEALLSLERAAPTQVEIPAKVIPELRALAQSRGLTATLQVVGAHRDGPPGVDFEGSMVGSLHGLNDFFLALETDRTVIQLLNVEIHQSSKTSYRAIVQGVMYTRKEE